MPIDCQRLWSLYSLPRRQVDSKGVESQMSMNDFLSLLYLPQPHIRFVFVFLDLCGIMSANFEYSLESIFDKGRRAT